MYKTLWLMFIKMDKKWIQVRHTEFCLLFFHYNWVHFCRTPVVRPRRGKVVLVVLVVLVGAVRSNSENCPIIHFRCFTDPHKIQIPKAHDAYYPMTPPWWQWQRHTQRQRQRQRQNFQEESLPVYISFLTKCCNRYI